MSRRRLDDLMTGFVSQVWNLLQGHRLTGKAPVVLMALASFEGHHGLFPSHESIAARAGCSVSTVIRALAEAYKLGIVERTRQRQRVGNRVVNGVNRYRLVLRCMEQAKVAAKHNAQRLREALNRRKLRVVSNCQNDSVPDSQSYFSNVSHSKNEWLDILQRLERGCTPSEAGYGV